MLAANHRISEETPALQALVYVFIALSALGVAAAAYFGLTFAPIEAATIAVAFGCIAILLVACVYLQGK